MTGIQRQYYILADRNGYPSLKFIRESPGIAYAAAQPMETLEEIKQRLDKLKAQGDEAYIWHVRMTRVA